MKKVLAIVTALALTQTPSGCTERTYDEHPGVVRKHWVEPLAGSPVHQYFVKVDDRDRIEVTEQMWNDCPVDAVWPDCWKK